MEIQTGGGVLGLGNPDGRGGLVVLEIRVEGGGGSKKHAIRRGGVDFFWNNPFLSKSVKCNFFYCKVPRLLENSFTLCLFGSAEISPPMIKTYKVS